MFDASNSRLQITFTVTAIIFFIVLSLLFIFRFQRRMSDDNAKKLLKVSRITTLILSVFTFIFLNRINSVRSDSLGLTAFMAWVILIPIIVFSIYPWEKKATKYGPLVAFIFIILNFIKPVTEIIRSFMN